MEGYTIVHGRWCDVEDAYSWLNNRRVHDGTWTVVRYGGRLFMVKHSILLMHFFRPLWMLTTCTDGRVHNGTWTVVRCGGRLFMVKQRKGTRWYMDSGAMWRTLIHG
ncbi:uncharacterized protein LOC118344289 [Juglans regia]|uniref:Uncharacterized protein LOC118344289 n=1 Tax=Juglans regia TaxID=51240 RepID=A0A6P9DZT7_JUGRE|nr:uncharacterized protein LOC118344289 [Juglans regia]